MSLHVDGRPGNAGFFGAEQFARMKPRSLFINAARGMVVDTESLREHILSGHIAGAALDVFPVEPKAQGDEFESPLRGLDNVILTPHVGGSTQEAQEEIGYFVAGKLAGFALEGRTELSVNLPAVLAPQLASGHRIGYLHHNVPGVLADHQRGSSPTAATTSPASTSPPAASRGTSSPTPPTRCRPTRSTKLAESEHTIWLRPGTPRRLDSVMPRSGRRLGQELFLRVAGPDGAAHARADPPPARARAGSSRAARSPGCTATRRCSSAASARCCCRRCTRPRCAASRSTPATAATCGAGWPHQPLPGGHDVRPRGRREQAVDAVRAIHKRVAGAMDDGTPYAANDPHLLGWVHVAEVDSFLRRTPSTAGDRWTGADRDNYVAQTAEVARRLGVLDPPTTEAELAAALAAYRPELRGTPEAREAIALPAAPAAAAAVRPAAVPACWRPPRSG